MSKPFDHQALHVSWEKTKSGWEPSVGDAPHVQLAPWSTTKVRHHLIIKPGPCIVDGLVGFVLQDATGGGAGWIWDGKQQLAAYELAA